MYSWPLATLLFVCQNVDGLVNDVDWSQAAQYASTLMAERYGRVSHETIEEETASADVSTMENTIVLKIALQCFIFIQPWKCDKLLTIYLEYAKAGAALSCWTCRDEAIQPVPAYVVWTQGIAASEDSEKWGVNSIVGRSTRRETEGVSPGQILKNMDRFAAFWLYSMIATKLKSTFYVKCYFFPSKSWQFVMCFQSVPR